MAARNTKRPGIEQIPCIQCPLQQCPGLRPLDDEQLELTQWLKSGEMHLEKGAQVLVQDSISPHLYTLLTGLAFRFKMMEDGRRQILNFLFPGDLLGLQGAVDEPLHHGVETLTAARLCVFPRPRVFDLFSRSPRLGFDMTWLASKEETALDEHLLAIGQRKATERVANLALFLFRRGKTTGLTKGNTLLFPLIQSQLADALGMSVVHTNKTLQSLRKQKILDWRSTDITILDEEKAIDHASFDLPEDINRPFI